MRAQDGRAMFELQLELHARAIGRRPNITVTHEGDLRSLFAPQG